MIRILGDFIKEWLKEIVVLFIIISLVDLIMPKGKVKRYVDFIMGLLIIFTVINPFTRLSRISINLDKEVNNYTSNLVSEASVLEDQNKQIETIYIKNLSLEIKKIIEENSDYMVDKINIETKPDKDNLFLIHEVMIIIDNKDLGNKKDLVRIDKIDIGKETYAFAEDTDNYLSIKSLVSSYLNIDMEKLKISKGDKGGGNNQ